MSQNLKKIIFLSIFFIIISGLFIFKNEKIYHQKIILKNIDNFKIENIFQLTNQYGQILDISEENLESAIFTRMDLKIIFSDILRSLQSNKVHRYEYKKYKNYTDKEFKYLKKILNNLELEGAYFLNPEQLSDTIVNIYANDIDKANEVFIDFFTFSSLNIFKKHLEDLSRFKTYRDKLFVSFFRKYSSEIEINNYKTLIVNFINNEKNFHLNKELNSIKFSDQFISDFSKLNNLIIEYLKTPSFFNYQKLSLSYKNLTSDKEYLKVYKKTKGLVSKIKINKKNTYLKLRLDYLQSIESFNSFLSSKEMQFFHYLKENLIKDTLFKINILSDEEIYEKFDLEKINNELLKFEIIQTLKDSYYIKDIYNNLMLKKYDISLYNNVKDEKVYETFTVKDEKLIEYLRNRLNLLGEQLNIAYILSLFLFSIISSIIIVGVSYSFKKKS